MKARRELIRVSSHCCLCHSGLQTLLSIHIHSVYGTAQTQHCVWLWERRRERVCSWPPQQHSASCKIWLKIFTWSAMLKTVWCSLHIWALIPKFDSKIFSFVHSKLILNIETTFLQMSRKLKGVWWERRKKRWWRKGIDFCLLHPKMITNSKIITKLTKSLQTLFLHLTLPY